MSTISVYDIHPIDGPMNCGPYDLLYASVDNNILWGNEPSHLARKAKEYKDCGTVLDVGCGDGVNSYFFENAGFRVKGIDVSSLALRGLRNRFNSHNRAILGNYIREDVSSGYREREKYDVIVSCGLFQCLSKRTRVSVHRNLHKNLKRDGIIIFSSLTSKIPLPIEHCTHGLDLAGDQEIDELFNDLEIIYSKEGVINDAHKPLVKSHKHSVMWVMEKIKA